MSVQDTRTGGCEGAGLSDVPSLPREASPGRLPTGHGVVLDLPVPPSVNAIRRINWVAAPKTAAWKRRADALLIAQKYRPLWLERFELHITFSGQHTGIDLDNGLKALIDYLVRIEAIADDAPANLRRLVVEWGEAPEGVRVQIVPWREA